ncbi:hypothetical protein G4Z16_10210 [Streptomyces bathyalis]|uniref:Integral membrane protein n=1 Tax=Streptomyces bathyalis TaxID=2710756 RepID=A0A7T1T5D7_9ACTN|nr:hypothetical protein [Streptomyces bathyalis]QPP06704.1 hypothetical protein G4Z16_10210 [Streptomyces bathyalis]
MSAHGSTPGTAADAGAGTAAPPVPAALPYEPRTPEAADPWDTRSRALVEGSGHRPGGGTGTRPTAAVPGQRTATQRTATQRTATHPVHPADPVRELMHRHRELCEQAVDPLEIAAALEAHGVTDRVAARFRHRDVFSLAEELFARVPRAEGRGSEVTTPAPPRGVGPAAAPVLAVPRVLLPLLVVLPGVLAAAGVAAVASAGDGSGQGPGAGRAGIAVALGLACALGPAAWCARWFAVRVRRRLERSRSLDEFAAGVWPLLTAATVLFTGALTGAQLAVREMAAVAGARIGGPGGRDTTVLPSELIPAVTALGVLLFAALLLAAHGFRGTAAAGVVAACALQAAAASAVAAVPPPAGGTDLAVAVACGCTALVLLACAYRLLSRASAHRPQDAPAKAEPPGGDGVRGGRERCECERDRCGSPGGAEI